MKHFLNILESAQKLIKIYCRADIKMNDIKKIYILKSFIIIETNLQVFKINLNDLEINL